MRSYSQLSTLAIVTLVILRVTIGWHFFKEGSTKVKEGGFSSVGFLGASVGPMAPFFKSMIPDYDGRIRISQKELFPKIDAFATAATKRYGFDKTQQDRLAKVVSDAKETIKTVYAQYDRELTEYTTGFERLEAMANDKTRMGTASLAGQRASVESEWKGKIKPVLSDVDKALALLESSAASIASPQQRARVSSLDVELVPPGLVSVSFVDKVIPIFDMVVGILLVIGLLTPLAGIAGGLFLVSVVLTQFPTAVGAQPTYYQAIEAAACFLLAFSDAGRYAGLDFIPWSFWHRKRLHARSHPQTVTSTAS